MTTDDSHKSSANTRGRPFQKGNSGRPKGAISRVTKAAQMLLDGEAKALTRKAIEQALAGDTVALKLCLERIIPPRKDRPIRFELPRIDRPEDGAKAQASILQGVAAGEITPQEASVVSQLIDGFVRSIETVELERRIAELESRHVE